MLACAEIKKTNLSSFGLFKKKKKITKDNKKKIGTNYYKNIKKKK